MAYPFYVTYVRVSHAHNETARAKVSKGGINLGNWRAQIMKAIQEKHVRMLRRFGVFSTLFTYWYILQTNK